jgi:hypothetical protein
VIIYRTYSGRRGLALNSAAAAALDRTVRFPSDM